MKKLILASVVSLMLAGCVSPAQRMANCEMQGISRDTCYQVEQQREFSAKRDALRASQRMVREDERRAMYEHRFNNNVRLHQEHRSESHGVRGDFHHPIRFHAQAAHKARIYKLNEASVKIGSDGLISVDGKPALEVEHTQQAITYQQGLYMVIVYRNGKVALTQNNQFVGFMKKVN